MKISQTWLASQTGVSERWIVARGRSPFSAFAGDQVPEAAAEVGAAEDCVEGRPGPEDRRRRRAHTCASLGTLGPVGRVGVLGRTLAALAPALRHPPQDQHGDHAERHVEQEGEDEGAPDAVRVGHRFRGSHVLVDDPRLAPDLGHDPARPEGEDRPHAGDRDHFEEPRGLRDVAFFEPGPAEPDDEQHQRRADPDHRVEGEVDEGVVRRPFVVGDRVQPGHLGARAEADQQRVEVGDPDRELDPARRADPAQVLGLVAAGFLDALHRRELGGLVVGDFAGRGVADQELERGGDAGDRQRDDQAEPVEAVAAPFQHPDRVDRCDQEADHHVGGEDHVRHLVGRRVVEEDLDRFHFGDLARRVEAEALRLVHPGVGRDHREGAADPGDEHRHARPEVGPGREPLPSVDVDREEDRLEEEEEPLDPEGDAEGGAEAFHEVRPEQAELEGEDGAGDGADGEGDRHRLRPALGQLQRVVVFLLQPDVVGDEDRRRQRHPERREHDVEGQRERHLLARGEQVGRRRRCQRNCAGQVHMSTVSLPFG